MTRPTVHRGVVLHALGDPARGGEVAVFEKGALAVDETGQVLFAGDAGDMPSAMSDFDVIDHGDRFIMPGFIDTHVHYAQVNVMASYGTQLLDWLNHYTFPAERRFKDEAYARSMADFFLDQLLQSGTTTALVFGTVHAGSADAFFSAAEERNLRMLCGKVMMDRNAPDYLLDTPASAYEDSAALIEKWHGRSRLLYAVTPRFAPTSSSEQLRLAGRLLEEYPGVRLQTHVSENTAECDWVGELFPECRDYVDVYDHHGLCGEHSVFAHGIHLSGREWDCLSDHNSAISFCPCSNLFIGSGLFDLHAADQHGVQVSLGSDVGGGDNLAMPRVINEAYKVLQLKGQNLDPFRAFYLATLGGAEALGLDGVVGNFKAGAEADFIVMDPYATPLLKSRIQASESFEEKLFSLLMLADDRSIAETWIMGKKLHS